jgi:hypothetical protein
MQRDNLFPNGSETLPEFARNTNTNSSPRFSKIHGNGGEANEIPGISRVRSAVQAQERASGAGSARSFTLLSSLSFFSKFPDAATNDFCSGEYRQAGDA